jgi:hypothetical protein
MQMDFIDIKEILQLSKIKFSQENELIAKKNILTFS